MINTNIIEFFRKHGRCINTISTFYILPPVICKDGTFLSIQAGVNYHCYPREDLEDFDYESFELRYTDDNDESLFDYIGYSKYEYNCVPVEVLNALVDKHGGIDEDAVDKCIKENERRF